MAAQFFKRDRYLNKLIAFKDTDLIKVVTGIRRCGKSTLLDMMRQHLLEEGVAPSRLFTFKMESFEFSEIKDYRELYTVVRSRVGEAESPYLFFDELQNVEDWEKAINALRVDLECDIYVTGSNAFLLSSEIATLISGRYVEIRVHPLSFAEYLEFGGYRLGDNSSAAIARGDGVVPLADLLEEYLTFGGFPYIAKSNLAEDACKEYVHSLYRTVIERDILSRDARRGRRAITQKGLLERICRYLSDNISNSTSINKIAGTLQGEVGGKTSNATVAAYIDALEETYLYTKVPRYDLKGRDILKTGGKYYIEDLGVRSYLDGYRGSDSGRVLENAIYNQLVYEGYEVYTGHLRAGEVDFVSIGSGADRKFIQVTESIDDRATREREFRPLKLLTLGKVKDASEKILIVKSGSHPSDIDGIKIVSAVDFLLGR